MSKKIKILHSRPLRHRFLTVGICVLGFFFTYLSGGFINDTATNLPDQKELPETPVSPVQEETLSSNTSSAPVANYSIRLERGLSESEEILLLKLPAQMKTSMEYRGKEVTATWTEESDILDLLNRIQKAERLPDQTEILSLSTSRSITFTLPYPDGYGNLYIFEGFVNGAKKAATIIQDNRNCLYSCNASVVSQLYDTLKPIETSLNAEKINVYSCRDYNKSILQAQCTQEEETQLLLDILNSLEKVGSSLDLSAPSYLIALLPSNSVSESEYCYVWTDEKQVKIAFADDSLTVYRSSAVTSSQMKKWIKEHSVK